MQGTPVHPLVGTDWPGYALQFVPNSQKQKPLDLPGSGFCEPATADHEAL
jgi:hypothetical protein